jgi:hypothetical protein
MKWLIFPLLLLAGCGGKSSNNSVSPAAPIESKFETRLKILEPRLSEIQTSLTEYKACLLNSGTEACEGWAQRLNSIQLGVSQ